MVKQTITIPSTAVSTILTFYIYITTKETTSTAPNDILEVQLGAAGSGALTEIMMFSNLSAPALGGAWVQESVDVSTFKGIPMDLKFKGTTNGTLGTVFLLDDMALTCQLAP